MSELFDKCNQYLPILLVAVLWLLLVPPRVLVLCVLPYGAVERRHKLHNLREFVAFKNYGR